jgi:hypothetical protein
MRSVLLSLPLALAATAAAAGPVSLAEGWNHQRLSLFSSNDYSYGASLGIASDGAVSLTWKPLGRSDWGARAASWSWAVDRSVPATDLAQKGGDDRNISLYFVFLPGDEAERLQGAGLLRLQRNDAVRILQYAWGGAHDRGEILASPYAPGQQVTVALRRAGTGQHSESVDLARDYAAAFGGQPGALVGLAVSADSDDTDSAVRARISDLTLR